jgi:hypothetical protein
MKAVGELRSVEPEGKGHDRLDQEVNEYTIPLQIDVQMEPLE